VVDEGELYRLRFVWEVGPEVWADGKMVGYIYMTRFTLGNLYHFI
jgi:hypothetical protein